MIGAVKNSTPDRYKLVWSRDPALRQLELPPTPPEDAAAELHREHEAKVKEAIAEHEKLHRIARETQDWSALIIGQDAPTFFVCRWLPDLIRRRWRGKLRANGGDLGYHEGIAMLALVALVDLENWGGTKFPKLVDTEAYGKIAPVTVLDQLRRGIIAAGGKDEDYRSLVNAIGGQVYEQEETTGPL